MRRVAALASGPMPVRLFDTCAVPDAPGDALWPDTRAFGGFAVAIGGAARRALFAGAMAAHERRRQRRGG
jgi:hypothetical protein